MVQLTGQAGILNVQAGQPAPLNLGAMGESLTGDMNGWFYEQTMRGNGYIWSTAIAGVALVAATAAMNNPTLINPNGSKRLLVIEKIAYNRTAVGTPVEGGVVYHFHRAAGIVGTGVDVVSLTQVAGQNARLDLSAAGDNSKMLFAPTTITFTAAPTFLVNAGISQAAATGTATGVNTFTAIDLINGAIVVPEGQAFTIGANVSFSTTYAISIYGFSIPTPSYFA